MKIYDISPVLSSSIAVWPGDQKFAQEIALDFESGENLRLSSIQTTLHVGAHADAPNHYHPDGVGIEARDLELYLGECQVIEVKISRGSRIRPKDIETVQIHAERVLFKTNSFPVPDEWNNDFNALSPELVELLATNGVKLVGIDTPSVDPMESKALESHNAIYKADMAILEGLVLSEVPEGVYELIALPLKIKGADASPVRAILRSKT